MIIGIDASRANRKKKTGIEWYSYYLIKELKKLTENSHHQFFLYTDKPLQGELARLPKNWQEKILRWPPRYLWTKIRFSWEMLRRKPDVLFVPSHVLPKFAPPKAVMTIHDLGYERYPEAYSRFARNYLRKNYRFAVRHAAKIIVPSEFTKRELISLYNAKPEKIEIVHLAYNDRIFKSKDNQNKIDEVLKKYKIKRPYLLFVGRLETKKGISCLVEAYKLLITNGELQHLNLILVGGKGVGYKEIKSKVQSLKPRVLQLGYLSDENERSCLYAGAEAFIFPSLYEGFGIPILEAMASGCTVIASDIEALKEVAGEATIFFKVGDSDDLARKIKEVLENQELRQKMISSGLERVKNFSWQNCAEKTLRVLLNW